METKELKAENTDRVKDDVLYTARIELRSMGDKKYVMPHVEYSHHFPDDYEGPWPASYIAFQDLMMLLQMMAQTTSIETDSDNLPEDPDQLAISVLSNVSDDVPSGPLN